MQTAYTPDSHCFGCGTSSLHHVCLAYNPLAGLKAVPTHLCPAGPATEDGLHLKSFRVENGLSATLQLASKYQAFPGTQTSDTSTI